MKPLKSLRTTESANPGCLLRLVRCHGRNHKIRISRRWLARSLCYKKQNVSLPTLEPSECTFEFVNVLQSSNTRTGKSYIPKLLIDAGALNPSEVGHLAN